MTLTDEQLATIRGRLEAATPGPWFIADDNAEKMEISIDAPTANKLGAWHIAEVCGGISLVEGEGSSHGNAVLIAHAPTYVRALLDEVERLRKFEADALPVLDAYEHMHTRAVRAEAEVESLRKPVGKEEWP